MNWIRIGKLYINLASVQGIRINTDTKGKFVEIFLGSNFTSIDLTDNNADILEKALEEHLSGVNITGLQIEERKA